MTPMENAPEPTAIVTAALQENWTLVSALVIWLAIALAKRRGWFQLIPDGYRLYVPVLLGVATAYVTAVVGGAELVEALQTAFTTGVAIGLQSMGIHGGAKEAHFTQYGDKGSES